MAFTTAKNLILSLLSSFVFLNVTATNNFTYFYVTNALSDGEMEIRIHYKGISAKETTVGSRSVMKMSLRQLTDGKNFIQLIYDERDNIRDCEYLHQRGQIEKFLKKFREDYHNLLTTSNVTVISLDDNPLPEEFEGWLDFEKLRGKCKKTHRAMKKSLRDNRRGKKRSRHTRSLLSDYLIAPGTYWCGFKDRAQSYTDLGGLSTTDKCCRKHDHCRKNIHGFTLKYNYYNSGPFTLSHCWCDNSFRACLKMADTSDANLVGKLFFNVVQTKCFVLKPQKVCARRSWWGKCTKKKYTKQAVLRDNLTY